MATKKNKEIKEENVENTGLKQSEDIKKLYIESFDDPQRMAFLLGRISAMLDVGNGISSSINETIRNEEEIYNEIKERIVKESKPKSKRRTTKKEATDEK